MKEFIEKLIDEKEEKVKVTSLEIIVTGTKNKPYFQIKYKEVGNEEYNIGYGSYDLNYVFDWKENCFEIVNQLAEEYNNDFCEWEKGSSGYVGYPAYYSKCCTTNSNGLEMQTHIISDWKFCPYCGKKIKVVPYQPKGE